MTIYGRQITASASQLKQDHRTGSKLAWKFINCLMHDGKKSVAKSVSSTTRMDIIVEKMHGRRPDRRSSHEAVENVKPDDRSPLEARRRGHLPGADAGQPRRQQSLAIRWLIESVREKKGRPMHVKLAEELMAAYSREGAAMTKRENVHRMADANKAFAHFAW